MHWLEGLGDQTGWFGWIGWFVGVGRLVEVAVPVGLVGLVGQVNLMRWLLGVTAGFLLNAQSQNLLKVSRLQQVSHFESLSDQ